MIRQFFALAAAAALTTTVSAQTLNVGDKAPKFEGKVNWLKGEPVNQFKQGQVYVIDFWATWCGPCKVEIPYFIEFNTTYGEQGLQVLGFDVDDEIPALTEYAERMGMNYPILIGAGRDDVLEAYGPMPGLPTTVIIGRDGKVCTSHTGLTEKAVFEEAIKALL